MSPTETSSSTKREIQVEIPAAEVARETETLIQKYQKLARIPGFRTGHAPASVIKQRFAEGIKSDVVDALVPRYFRKETDKLGLTPVSQPRVTDLHVHDGEPLRFKASFEVMPTIRVEDYKELRADKPDISVTDEEVEQSLKNLQEQRATFTTIEGKSAGRRRLCPGFARRKTEGCRGRGCKRSEARPHRIEPRAYGRYSGGDRRSGDDARVYREFAGRVRGR